MSDSLIIIPTYNEKENIEKINRLAEERQREKALCRTDLQRQEQAAERVRSALKKINTQPDIAKEAVNKAGVAANAREGVRPLSEGGK